MAQKITPKLPPFTNNTNGHCGIYALANLYNDGGIIDKYPPLRLGYSFEDLNDIVSSLNEGGVTELQLQTVQMSGAEMRAADDFVRRILNGLPKNSCLPAIAQVEIAGSPHAVAVIFVNRNAYVFDSAIDEVKTYAATNLKFNRLALLVDVNLKSPIAFAEPPNHLFNE